MSRPLILFGAFDRHNFGDLLFAPLAATFGTDRRVCFAGRVARDWRAIGGPRVEALDVLLHRLREPVDVLHVGGELLDCSAWEAAVMTRPAADARRIVARLDAQAEARRDWAHRLLRCTDQAPYLVDPRCLPRGSRVFHHGLGGVGLPTCEPAMQAEVLRKLSASQGLTVREHRTLAVLRAGGLPAQLSADPVAQLTQRFSRRIARYVRDGCVAALRQRLRADYLVLQCSAEFGDDATLDIIGQAVQRFAARERLAVVLLRAGAAPWHDDLGVLRRLRARLGGVPSAIVSALNPWTIVATIAASRLFCGSSLHGRIVAAAHGKARLSLVPDARSGAKQRAYIETWDAPAGAACAPVDAHALQCMLRMAMSGNDQAAAAAQSAAQAAWQAGRTLREALASAQPAASAGS